ncbi:MAG: MFS transporter, partial [Paenibacillaceae bacterium]|nr:MFS transporter [Paenibacillaceae bacterium]
MSRIATTTTSLTKRQLIVFSTLCCLVYFTSYLTRLNYSAAISEIVNSLQITNQLAGMAVIGSFIAYGISQPVFGFLGDIVKPRHMIFAGLTASAICNLLISFVSNIYLMTFIWSLNGLFQAMLWPPLVRIMAQTLPASNYRKASVSVVASASFGTIVVY